MSKLMFPLASLIVASRPHMWQCTAMILRREAMLPPAVFRLHMFFAGAGILLNAGWLVQIISILKEERASARSS